MERTLTFTPPSKVQHPDVHQCIVPLWLWQDIPHIRSGCLTLGWNLRSIYAVRPSMHGNTAHLICFRPSHLPPSKPSRAELCIIGSFPNRQLTTTRVMTSAWYCDFYYFRD